MSETDSGMSPAQVLARHGVVRGATGARHGPDVVHPDPDCRALKQTDDNKRIEHRGALPLRCSVCEQCFGGRYE